MIPYNVVLADDHVMFRHGLRNIIELTEDIHVSGEANDGFELLELLKTTRPDLIVLDISMPNLHGLDTLREIKKLYPDVKVLILTMHRKKEFFRQSLKNGAHGFLLKEEPSSELIRAINIIRGGEKYFTPLLSSTLSALIIEEKDPRFLSARERDVLSYLAAGKKAKDISKLLFISIHTVRRHRQNIMNKLNIKSQADLIKYALSHGYSDTPP